MENMNRRLWVSATDNGRWAVGEGDKEIAWFLHRADAHRFWLAGELMDLLQAVHLNWTEINDREFSGPSGALHKRIEEVLASMSVRGLGK